MLHICASSADGGITIPKFSEGAKLLEIKIYYSTALLKIPGSKENSTTDEIVVHEIAHAVTTIILVNKLNGGSWDMSNKNYGNSLLERTYQKSINLFQDPSRLFQEIRSVRFENLYRSSRRKLKFRRKYYDSELKIDLSSF